MAHVAQDHAAAKNTAARVLKVTLWIACDRQNQLAHRRVLLLLLLAQGAVVSVLKTPTARSTIGMAFIRSKTRLTVGIGKGSDEPSAEQVA